MGDKIDITEKNCLLVEMSILLISLDRTIPFMKEMELYFSNIELFHKTVRQYVRKQQQMKYSEEELLLYAEYVRFISDLYSSLLTDIEKIEGESGAAALQSWIRRFIMYENESSWRFAWHGLMFTFDASQEPVLIRLGLPEEKIPALLRLVDRYGDLASELEDQIEEAESQPLQGWDEEQYRIYRKESDDVSPLDYLSDHLLALRFHKVWHEILVLLNPNEMDILNQWGQYITALKGRIPPANAIIPEKYRVLL
jgi:hypothetical protein